MKTIRIICTAFLLTMCLGGMFLDSNDAPVLEYRFAAPLTEYWAGGDQLGRDVLARTIRATTRSASTVLIAWLVATSIGIFVGIIGALAENRFLGKVIEAGIRVVFTTPFILALIGLRVLLGSGTPAILVVILLFGWAYPARHARSIAKDALGAPFTRAAVSMGFTSRRLARVVLFPTCFRPVLAASGGLIAEFFAIDLALTVFGFGPSPPAPTLGNLLIDGMRFITIAPWMVLTPLAVICLVCLGFRMLLHHQAR